MSSRDFNYHRGGLVSLVSNQVCDTLLWSKFSNTSFSGSYYGKKSVPKLDISTDFCCTDFCFFLTVSQSLSSWINVVKTLPNPSFYLISERMSLPTLASSRARQIFSQLAVIKPLEVISETRMITASPFSPILFSTTCAWQPHSQHVWLKPQIRHIFSINWWLSTICFPHFWSHLSLAEGSLISFWSREAWLSLLHF